MLFTFDTFGDCLQPETACHMKNGANHRGIAFRFEHALHKRPVNLDPAGWTASKQAERSITGTEIVEVAAKRVSRVSKRVVSTPSRPVRVPVMEGVVVPGFCVKCGPINTAQAGRGPRLVAATALTSVAGRARARYVLFSPMCAATGSSAAAMHDRAA